MKGKKKGKLHNHKHKTKKDKHNSAGVTGYISRSQVTKKLQLSIQEFRKLCILKGVHPVEPGLKRLRKDKGKTWYYLKDVNFMRRDELVQWYRDMKIYKKKVAYLKGVNRPTELAALKQRKPSLNMDHFVRERYPTLQDAVNDLDDALSMICLFVEMQHGVAAKVMKKKQFEECIRLKSEWMAYVTEVHALRKVFVSIKGIYYQSDVLGSAITWLAPHPQRMKVPLTVDVLTMTFFVEFYTTMLNFVFYRLYTDLGLQYPPRIDSGLMGEGQTVKAVHIEKIVHQTPVLKNETPAAPSAHPAPLTAAEKARIDIVNSKLAHIISVEETDTKMIEEVEIKKEKEEEEGAQIPDEFKKVDEQEGENKEQYQEKAKLFQGFKFFINREIPKQEIRFMIRAFGGVDFTEYDCKETDKKITHQIVDRDIDKSKMLINREYIQPQWIFDSINAGILLPYHEYAHDATLPPHISPFVNDQLKGYVPRQREHMNELIAAQQDKEEEKAGKKKPKGEKDEEEEEDGLRVIGEHDDDEDQSTLEAQFERELAAEQEGIRYDGYVQDALGQTEMYSDSEDEATAALKKPKKTNKQVREEKAAQEEKERMDRTMDLLSHKLKRKVKSIQGRLERREDQNRMLEDKRAALEKKKKKEAREAARAPPAPTPAPEKEKEEKGKKNKGNNKRKEGSAETVQPTKKAKK